MYPFERNLQKYKYNVRNKAHVEGCICNAHIVEEASSFCSHYFEPHVYTRHRKVPRNDDGGIGEQDGYAGNLSIFSYPGRGFGELNWRYLTEQERKAAHSYILLNCREVQPYVEILWTLFIKIFHKLRSRKWTGNLIKILHHGSQDMLEST